MNDNQDNKMNTNALNSEQEEFITLLSKRGYDSLKGNNLEEAISSFSEIIKMDPKNNYALVGLGDTYRRKGDFPEAQRHYQRCLENDPKNSFALFGIADSYKAMNKLMPAISYWEQYLEQDANNVNVLTRVADAYRKLKNFEKSRDFYQKVLEIEEDNDYALIGLGHLYFDFSEFKTALHFWERMYNKKPDEIDIRILTSIGNCHRKLLTFDKGLKYFQLALEKDPNNFFALFGMADCYRGIRDYEKSLKYWLKILENDPNNKVILTRAGDAFRVLKNYEKAQEFYERALRIDYDSYAVLGLALIDRDHRRFDEAIDRLEELLKQNPRNHRVYIEIANCYLDQGKKEQALDTLMRYQRYGSKNNYVASLIEKIKHE